MLPWAVHISDGVLLAQWQAIGFVLAGLFVVLGGWKMREEDVPATALMAAAFFVATLIHVRIGPTSAHLLLNGLMGVVLGRRAAPAVFTGLLLQALLMGHGGLLSLGVNTCVMLLPALIAGAMFRLLHPICLAHPRLAIAVPMILIGITAGLVVALALLGDRLLDDPAQTTTTAWEVMRYPATGICLLLVPITACILWFRGKDGDAPEFALGVALGQSAVLMTLVLNAGVLILGGEKSYAVPAILMFLVHLPIVLIEGVVLGSISAFLARVKPEMLGLPPTIRPEEARC